MAGNRERVFLDVLYAQIAFGAACVAMFVAVMSARALAPLRPYAANFARVQYVDIGTKLARPGWRDGYFVVSMFVAVLTLRAVFQLLVYWFLVLVRRDMTIKKKIRFSEQAWCVLYYSFAAIWGLQLLQTQPYGFGSARSLWEGFPHYFIDAGVKQYYLTVFAFWFAQIPIIFMEQPRKDHWQMLMHHFVTCMLVLGSYAYSYTRIGHLVMIMMDSVDVFLALAKCSKYWGCPKLVTDSIFGVFLLTWVILRHFVYMYEMLYGAFPAARELHGRCAVVDGKAVQCFNVRAHYFFFALALALQAITVMWLFMIIKVVMRVLRGDGADDERSDSSDSEADTNTKHKET